MSDGDHTFVSFELPESELETFEDRIADDEQFDNRSAALRYLVRRYNDYQVW